MTALGIPIVPKFALERLDPHEVGFQRKWTLSEEARRDIEEIERHSFWWPSRFWSRP